MSQKTQNLSQSEKQNELIIDPERNWVFKTEDELFDFFENDIALIEKHFKKLIDKSEPNKGTSTTLEFTLDDPTEVWERTDLFSDGRPVYTFIKDFEGKTEVAFCHCFEKEPVFIYSHFTVSQTEDLSELEFEFLVRDKEMKEVFKGALEGDSLYEGDDLSMGLYKAMLTLRSESDYSEEAFGDFLGIRETTIEEADEIWRAMDSYGNNLVYFIKGFEEEGRDQVFHYVAVTLEDSVSDSNVLLFSFPTKDEGLLGRYRVGENLQTEEIVQEGSH